MAINEFCKLDVVCCTAKTPVADIAGLMRLHHVGDVIVTGTNGNARIPLGIVTDRDIVIEAVAPGVDLNMLTAEDIMNSPLETIREDASFLETLQAMARHKVRRLPVIRSDGTLFGIVTADDMISMLVTELSAISTVVADQPAIERQIRR